MKIPGYLDDLTLHPPSSLYGLPFLPVADVAPAWQLLCPCIFNTRPTIVVSDYLNYFDSTWIFPLLSGSLERVFRCGA